MAKTLPTMILASVLAATGVAQAAPAAEGAVGVGVEAQINGNGGISLNYNTEKFHVGGFLGLEDPAGANNTVIGFGGRFYYHVHNKSATADFSVGGSVGLLSVPVNPGDNRATLMFIEPGIQIRAFIVPNVALSLSAGIVIGAADAGGVAFDGQLTGGAGIHYYFF
ncbi:MAG: hypothetical protein KF773_01355 [Deltaproteobacteria bacterium]|nr:hypothetical protein [Deltaproteobacteria bacterium]MCW5800838.1 hypothetical protein [Deltaproteobacteria bacterium]